MRLEPGAGAASSASEALAAVRHNCIGCSRRSQSAADEQRAPLVNDPFQDQIISSLGQIDILERFDEPVEITQADFLFA